MQLVKRYRYEKSNGSPVWLEFDPMFSCIYCDEPVRHLSMGGPAVCPKCDCQASTHAMMNARRRLDALPFDETWPVYEAHYKR